MDNLIISQENQGVFTIKLNRLDKKNALNNEMYRQLCQSFNYASETSSVHCVLIQGDHTCFTAGNDLKDFLQSSECDELAAVKLIQILANFNKPLVAAVAGAAVGIGTTLLLHCDMVIAADNSKFQLPFTQLGLCPEAGASLTLPLRIGHNRAFELLVLGKPFTAEQALHYGLINQVCAPEALLEIANNIAQTIAQLPHDAVITSRKLLRQATAKALPQVMQEEVKEFARLMASPECKKIMSQFFS